jgi:hypothetical protein
MNCCARTRDCGPQPHRGINWERTERSLLGFTPFLSLFLVALSAPVGFGQQQFGTSPGVSLVAEGPETSPSASWTSYEANFWSILGGSCTLGPANQLPPDGSMATQITMTATGGFFVQYTLPFVRDLGNVDTLVFWANTSATRIGDFVFLVDWYGNRAWYTLNLYSSNGWQQFQFFLNSPVGMNLGFDRGHVMAVRFAQSGMVSGDVVTIGRPWFEWGTVNHADSAAGWYVDIGSGTISSTTDAMAGKSSLLANLTSNFWGQADIATSFASTGAKWDWSSKTSISFFYKDSLLGVDHYCLVYDANGSYREWVFENPLPGHWIRVTIQLNHPAYEPSGPVDLSRLAAFEVGVFDGTPGTAYSFQIDELCVH